MVILVLIYVQEKKIHLVLKEDEIVKISSSPNYDEVAYHSQDLEVENLIEYLNELTYKRVVINASKGWQIAIKSRSYNILIQSPYIQINGFWYKSDGLNIEAISKFYIRQD